MKLPNQNQKALPAPIPWYRTRWFWGVVIGIQITWGGVRFYTHLDSAGRSFVNTLEYITYDSGAALFSLFGKTLFGVGGARAFTAFYLILMLLLAYKTFCKPRVNLWYPIIFTLLFVPGSFVGILALLSFY